MYKIPCEAAIGGKEVKIGDGAVTVTVAIPDFVGSATLVAITWYVPECPGDIYVPLLTVPPIAPSCMDQVTAVLLVFVTDHENGNAVLMPTVTVLGITVTLIGSAAIVVILSACVFVCAGEPESVALTVKFVVVAVPVGVPEMTPEALFRVSPGGNMPELTLQVTGAVPPVEASVAV